MKSKNFISFVLSLIMAISSCNISFAEESTEETTVLQTEDTSSVSLQDVEIGEITDAKFIGGTETIINENGEKETKKIKEDPLNIEDEVTSLAAVNVAKAMPKAGEDGFIVPLEKPMPKAGANGFIAEISEPDPNATVITTAEELANIQSGSYVLGNDIDLSTYNDGIWTPINPTGEVILDGQGHKILNMIIPASARIRDVGLFGNVKYFINIKNIGIAENCDITTSNSYGSVGGLISCNNSTNIIIENCYNNGKISSSSCEYGGGLIGSINNGNSNITIENSYNTAIISGCDLSGGLIGGTVYDPDSDSNTIININNCYNIGSISSDYYNDYSSSGGLVGEANWSKIKEVTIENSYNSGDISSSTGTSSGYFGYSGGLIGNAGSANTIIKNSCNTASILSKGGMFSYSGGLVAGSGATLIIENSYNIATVSADTRGYYSHSGGLIGSCGKITEIANCYNIGDISSFNLYSSYDESRSCSGGLIGYGNGYNDSCGYVAKANVANSCNFGKIDAKDDSKSNTYHTYQGAIIGCIAEVIFKGSNCYKGDYGICGNADVIITYNDGSTCIKYREPISESDEILITVVGDSSEIEEEEAIVPGAKVTIGDNTYTTDENGQVTVKKSSINIGEYEEQFTIQTEAEGHFSQTDYFSIYASKCEISLLRFDKGEILISDPIFKDNDGTSRNTADCIIKLPLTDKNTYELEIPNIDWNHYEPGEVYLAGIKSDGKTDEITKMYKFDDYKIKLDIAQKFDIDDNIYIIAFNADKSKRWEKYTHIRTIVFDKEQTPIPEPNVKSEDIKNMPFLDGLKLDFKVNIDDIIENSDKLEFKDNKITYEYDETKTRYNKKNNIPFLKNFLDTAKLQTSTGFKIVMPLDLSDSVPEDRRTAEASVKIGMTFAYSNSGVEHKELPLLKVMYLKYDFNIVTPAGIIIPCFAEFELSAGIEGETGFKSVLGKNARPVEANIKITPKINGLVNAGVGVKNGEIYDVSATAYGDGTINVPIELAIKEPQDSVVGINGSANVDITAELEYGIKLNATIYNYGLSVKYPIGKHEYPSKSKNVVLMADSDNLELIGRDYLKNGGGFVGSSQINLMSNDNSDSENLIYKNIISAAEAKSQIIDGKEVIVFTTDDTSKEQQNALTLMYSVNENGAWSQPKEIYDDKTMDSAVDFDGKFVIWENTNSEISADEKDIQEIMGKSEIYACKYDANGWSEPFVLTNNNIADLAPIIRSNDDNAMAAWISNSENDIFGMSGQNDISYAIYKNGVWSDVKTIADVGSVTRLEGSFDGEDGTIIYRKDNDIYEIKTGTETSKKIKSIPETSIYGYSCENNKEVYAYFNENRDISVSVNGKDYTIQTEAETFNAPIIAQDENNIFVCWQESVDSNIALKCIKFSDDKWTDKVNLATGDFNVVRPCVLINSDGKPVATYLKQEPYKKNENGEYKEGVTDLYITEVSESADISIDPLSFDFYGDELRENGTAHCFVNVKNDGFSQINGLSINVSDDDGNNIAQINKDVAIGAGKSEDIEFSFDLNKDIKKSNVAINITPVSGTDKNTENNIIYTDFNLNSISVEEAYFGKRDNKYILNTTIKNDGTCDTEDFRIQIHQGSKDGDVVFEKTYYGLAVNDKIMLNEEIENAVVKDGEIKYYVTADLLDENGEVTYSDFDFALLYLSDYEEVSTDNMLAFILGEKRSLNNNFEDKQSTITDIDFKVIDNGTFDKNKLSFSSSKDKYVPVNDIKFITDNYTVNDSSIKVELFNTYKLPVVYVAYDNKVVNNNPVYIGNKHFIYGDVDDNYEITVNDASSVLQKVLNNSVKLPVESRTDVNYMECADVSNDGKLTALDAAIILQKALDSNFVMPVELKK